MKTPKGVRAFYPIPALILLLPSMGIGLSCSSPLKKSEAYHEMNMQGTYACTPVALNPPRAESPAQADSMKIRCYRDEWSVDGTVSSLHRILYNSIHCEKPIAKIEITSTTAPCRLTKLDADWIAEEDGKCMLQHVPLDTPTSIEVLHACPRAIPRFCQEAHRHLEVIPNGQNLVVQSSSGSYRAQCKRYEAP